MPWIPVLSPHGSGSHGFISICMKNIIAGKHYFKDNFQPCRQGASFISFRHYSISNLDLQIKFSMILSNKQRTTLDGAGWTAVIDKLIVAFLFAHCTGTQVLKALVGKGSKQTFLNVEI